MTIPISQQYIRVKPGNNPDPAIFCPTNGYEKPEIWEPPVVVPAPESEQILLLCSDDSPCAIYFYMSVSSGNKKVEILDDEMNVLSTNTFSSTAYLCEFPTQNTGTYYIVRLTPETAGQSIRTFYVYNYNYLAASSYKIFQAKYYTPNLTSLQGAFSGVVAFRQCDFYTNMNSVTTAYQAFYNSGVEIVNWPAQMAALTNFTYAFYGTFNLRVSDWSGLTLSANVSLASMYQNSLVEEIYLPPTLSSITSLQYFAQNAYKLKTVQLPTSANNSCTTCHGAFEKCYSVGSLSFPEMAACTTIGSVAGYCYAATSVTFSGAMNSCTTIANAFWYCYNLETITLPTSMNGLTSMGNSFLYTWSLKHLTLPTSWNNATHNFSDLWSISQAYIMEDISTCNDWGTAQHSIGVSSFMLTAFYQPSARCFRLSIGYRNATGVVKKAPATNVEVDWANSTFADTNSPQIQLVAELDSTELDRIFTVLPTVTSKTIRVSDCPGYASCTPSIATAKGWTVN